MSLNRQFVSIIFCENSPSKSLFLKKYFQYFSCLTIVINSFVLSDKISIGIRK